MFNETRYLNDESLKNCAWKNHPSVGLGNLIRQRSCHPEERLPTAYDNKSGIKADAWKKNPKVRREDLIFYIFSILTPQHLILSSSPGDREFT